MHLNQLSIQNLRNIISEKLAFSPHLNLFFGANGSGKTSILEAIYYLGMGRSFRNRVNTRLIHYDANSFSLFSTLELDKQQHAIGLERQHNGDMRVRLNQENVRSFIEITQLLPLQFLNTESRQLLTGSSKLRRQFIDWGTFHVEPNFLKTWQQVQRILKQRNAALKERAPKSLIQLWDDELIKATEPLDQMRRSYTSNLISTLKGILSQFFNPVPELIFSYVPGWNIKEGLANCLISNFTSDFKSGYTHSGPQRADLQIKLNNIFAHEILSNGQQKLLVYALRLAQGQLLLQQTGRSCVYLLDDLPAELDTENRARLLEMLIHMESQVFITGVAAESFQNLSTSKMRMFHVEHGRTTAVSM
jgi:DNA replication and repair protein RecF